MPNQIELTENEIDEAEWSLLQILAHPVMFREFINEDIEGWEPLEPHEREWSTCTNTYIAMCCGRGVHKTTAMIEMLYYWMINNMFTPGDPSLFVVVPNKAQKDLSFFKIRSACLTHWLIRQFVDPNAINITDGKIEFRNGFQFLMRIAGAAGSDANVIGIHTIRIWVDEAQEFPWQTWQSLQNCLKREVKGHQMFVSGVPNGRRQENVLYVMDQEDEKYISFNVSQTQMSYWTPEMELETRKKYNSLREDSEDYKHYVLGQHGVPSFTVFDRNRFTRDNFETLKVIYTQQMFDRARRIDPSTGVERYFIEEVVQAPPMPLDIGHEMRVGLGYDVGFSPDPTVFFVLYEDHLGKWKNLLRVVLQRVEYPIQREVMAFLDKVYGFDFIGIDMGGPGKVQYQDLTNDLSPYHNLFKERLYPVEFGGYMVVAVDEEGVEKKDQTKRIAVETLSRWVHDGRFVFSNADNDLMEELERTQFTRTITGEPVYRTDNDHQMAAMMCAVMSYENKFGPPVVRERQPLQVKLLPAKWFDPLGEMDRW